MVANINRVNLDHQHITELHKRHEEWETGEIWSFRELYLYNIVSTQYKKHQPELETQVSESKYEKNVSSQHKIWLQSRQD